MQGTPTLGAWLRDYPWKSAYGPNDRPLEEFYIPALSRAVRYDRIAGFFSSYALAAAAQGVAKLVARGGRMRLLVGAQLSKEDVDAVLSGISLQDRLASPLLGILRSAEALADALVRERLKVLAWLVAHDRLEIRVAVEADPHTRQPVPSGGYFHAKGGVLVDEAGDGIAFSGSINETATAWLYNYERFHVFCSWRDPEHFQEEADTFERLWRNAEAGWLTVTIPDAVRQELIRLAPPEPPVEEPAQGRAVAADAKARWLAQYLRDAPHLVHYGWRVGVETAAVRPFPNQRTVAYDVLDRFPCRRLLADEVGLGKTIEAGLILRSLLLSGRVKRCLILTPRSLAKQWQEELRDRFLVDAPFYDGARFVRFRHPKDEHEPVPEGRSPWEVHRVVIASAQMVKRQDRATALLEAAPWDLVIVDEAHHARRRDFLDLRRYRPNRLLSLLERLKERTRALLLLTATPMQVHPVEVWDLLRLLGMPGRWQDEQDAFLAYFGQLRQPYDEIDWDRVLPLVRDAISAWGWDVQWERGASQELGPVGLHRVKAAIEQGTWRHALNLKGKEREWALDALKRHTPVARLMYRHTRTLLRDYHHRGLLPQPVPERRPQPVWLEMSDEEVRLYRQVERYISTYYKRYEDVRLGLGFIMTVYRRRLASSLYALAESLRRRREFLMGQWKDPDRPMGLGDEDWEEADLQRDEVEEIGERPEFWEEEVQEVDRLLEQLEQVGAEGKLVKLRAHLMDTLRRWDQVLVFTQYTDTLDFLRRELLPTFGSRLGCYSGRGGEVWDEAEQKWAYLSKDKVQDSFTKGTLKVLLCSEAAAEGLNLQSCGVLLNYDMPWNPMKVEQRIGRVDRIGQRRREVTIWHYFYERTVEAQVYRALGDRIGWFETVVGELQPILHRAQTVIRDAAVASAEERPTVLESGLRRLEQEYQSLRQHASPTSFWPPASQPACAAAPVTLDDLESLLTTHAPWKDRAIHGGMEGLFRLVWDSVTAEVTARPEVLGQLKAESDESGPEFWTYGDDVFARALELPPPPSRNDLVRLEDARDGVPFVGYYRFADSRWVAQTDVSGLLDCVDAQPNNEVPVQGGAVEMFESDCRRFVKPDSDASPKLGA